MAFFDTLDSLGKVAFDTLDKAVRAAEQLGDKTKEKLDPLIDKSALASRVRDRVRERLGRDDDFVAPTPEKNESPFAPPAEHQAPAEPGRPPEPHDRGT